MAILKPKSTAEGSSSQGREVSIVSFIKSKSVIMVVTLAIALLFLLSSAVSVPFLRSRNHSGGVFPLSDGQSAQSPTTTALLAVSASLNCPANYMINAGQSPKISCLLTYQNVEGAVITLTVVCATAGSCSGWKIDQPAANATGQSSFISGIGAGSHSTTVIFQIASPNSCSTTGSVSCHISLQIAAAISSSTIASAITDITIGSGAVLSCPNTVQIFPASSGAISCILEWAGFSSFAFNVFSNCQSTTCASWNITPLWPLFSNLDNGGVTVELPVYFVAPTQNQCQTTNDCHVTETIFVELNNGSIISEATVILTESTSATNVSLANACLNGLTVDINGVETGAKDYLLGWTWGDGQFGNGSFPQSHIYSTSGTYNVSVSAYFASGIFAFSVSSGESVTVQNGVVTNCEPLTISSGAGGSVSYQSSVGSATVNAGNSATLELDQNDNLSLTANSGTGYSFSGWSLSTGITGVGSSAVDTSAASITILIRSSSTISASFSPVTTCASTGLGLCPFNPNTLYEVWSETSTSSSQVIYQPTICAPASSTGSGSGYLTSNSIKEGTVTDCYANKYSIQSSLPIEGVPYSEWIQVEWTGTSSVDAPTHLTSTAANFPGSTISLPSWSDATTMCDLAGSGQFSVSQNANYYGVNVQLQPDKATWLTYDCISSWNFDSSSSGNILSADLTGANDAIDTMLAFAASAAAGAATGLLDGAVQFYTVFSIQVVMGANFDLEFQTSLPTVYENPPSVSALAPGDKWTALAWWLGAEVGALAVTAALDIGAILAASACVPTAGLGCVVSLVLIVDSSLAGRDLYNWGQAQVGDPSANYTKMVPGPVVPQSYAKLGNTTASRLLVDEFLYSSYMNASVESNARSRGAFVASSDHYAYLQENASAQYAANASVYYSQLMQLAGQLLMQLNDSGQFTVDNFEKGLAAFSSGNLSANLAPIVSQLGLSPSVLNLNLANTHFAPLSSLLNNFSASTDPTIALFKGDQQLAGQLSNSANPVHTGAPSCIFVPIIIVAITCFVVVAFLVRRQKRQTKT